MSCERIRWRFISPQMSLWRRHDPHGWIRIQPRIGRYRPRSGLETNPTTLIKILIILDPAVRPFEAGGEAEGTYLLLLDPSPSAREVVSRAERDELLGAGARARCGVDLAQGGVRSEHTLAEEEIRSGGNEPRRRAEDCGCRKECEAHRDGAALVERVEGGEVWGRGGAGRV